MYFENLNMKKMGTVSHSYMVDWAVKKMVSMENIKKWGNSLLNNFNKIVKNHNFLATIIATMKKTYVWKDRYTYIDI